MASYTRTFVATNGTGQIHFYGLGLDDPTDHWENLGFEQITGFSHGHHTRSGGGSDTLNFTDLDNVDAVIVGRIEDFDASRDEIRIEGELLDLYDLPDNVRIVEYNGHHNDPLADPQQWLLIDTGEGAIFYVLEGARTDMTGDGGSSSGQDENHFLLSAPDFSALQDVRYVDPVNVVPTGYTADGGRTYNDIDESVGDVRKIIFGVSGGDLIAAGLNDDRVWSGAGEDVVWGGSGHDRIRGMANADQLFGGPGDDQLHGGRGNDVLSGDQGIDTLIGAGGGDVFVFADGFGFDLIVDFDATAPGEQIDLSGTEAISSFADLLQDHAWQAGTDVIINAGGGDELTLRSQSLGDLSADDFIF